MSRKNPYTKIKIPSFTLNLLDNREVHFINKLVTTGAYSKFLMFFVRKVVNNPTFLNDLNNTNNDKETPTLTEISSMIKEMNKEQSEMFKEIQESNEKAHQALSNMEQVLEVNDKLQETLTDLMSKLSESAEGSRILQQLNNNDTVTKLVNESKQITETTRRVFTDVPNISSNPMEEVKRVPTFNTVVEEDDDEDGDLFETDLTEEELNATFTRFRGK